MNYHNVIVQEDLKAIYKNDFHWENLKEQTVLITGASGMIASYMVAMLLYLNDECNLNILVLALVRNEKKAKEQFTNLLERCDFKLIVQDVCDTVEYDGNIDYIIHAASQVSPNQFVNDPVGTISANTIGTDNMLKLAIKKDIKVFLYLSTREIYGKQIGEKQFIAETDYGVTDPTLVRSCYPESKRISETLCAAYKHQFGLNCQIARIAHTYGPGMTIGDGRVVGDFIKNVIDNKNIILKSVGDTVLSITYISDIIAGLFLQLLSDNEQWIFNWTTMTDILTVKELAELLVSLYPQKNIALEFQISSVGSAGYLSHKMGLLDASLANSIGWLPRVSLEQGLQRTILYAEQVK